MELEILSFLLKKEVIKIEPDWDGMVYVRFNNGDSLHTEWMTLFYQVCQNIEEIKNMN